MDPRNGGSPYGFPFPMPPGPYPFHPQMGMDGRISDPRYNWDPSRLMGLTPSQGGSPILGEMPFGRLPPDSGRGVGGDAFLHPAYRMNPFWEQMYRMHASSLRGMPIDTRGPMSPDYLRQAGLPPGSDVFSMHGASSTPSIGIPFSSDGSRITTPRPSSLSRLGRKRPLSISPFAQDFDLNTVIRMSPNSLISGGNGSRCSSSASGTFGHLAAGTMSPSAPFDPARFQQWQQYMMRQNAQAFFPSAFYPPGMTKLATQTPGHGPNEDVHMEPLDRAERSKREIPSHGVVSSSINPTDNRRKERVKKEAAQSTSTTGDGDDEDGHGSPNRNNEPDDFIETHCRWVGCDMDFESQDELVAHVNQEHVASNKKTFVCRWMDCCREEKPFKAQYMLVVHMRRHTGEKPHKCTYKGCNKAYSRLENLKTHLRSHTGERPYMCEVPGCTKAFSNASDRAKHQNRTHSNAKPYMCKFPGCQKRYTDPSSLRKHVKTVHGVDYMNNKRHKANDVPRKHRFEDGEGHGRGGDDSTRSSKSFTESEPSTPRGNIKQESVDRSPSYSLPPSVFANCPQDSPSSMDYHLQSSQNAGLSLNHRSNDPIAEEEIDLDLDNQNDPFGGHDVAVAARSNRYAMRGPACHKPPPPLASSYAPRSPGQAGPVIMSELSERFTEMRTFIEPREQYFTPTQDVRRDSNVSMSSAYYSSVPSDSSHTLSAYPSRRASEVSMGYAPQSSPPYDPISVGSSRRSSEPNLAGTLSGYQQKMQMRSLQTGQRWQPTPQPPRVPSAQPGGTQTNGQYHGNRRASAPVLPISQLQRTQPLTRRNLIRHNSLSANSSVAAPLFSNTGFLNFEEEHGHEEAMEDQQSNQMVIPEDMVRYLEQYGAQHRRDNDEDEDDNDSDLPPTIQQNYAEGLNQAYVDVVAPPTFTSYPSNLHHAGQRRASFTHGYQQHIPECPPTRGQSYHSTQPPSSGYQRQRRASLQCPLPVAMPRPLTEGSPDSYEVTSTTNDGRFASYSEYRGRTDAPNDGRIQQSQQHGSGDVHSLQSGTVVADMHTMMSSLDHENQFLKMIQ